jgi:methanogenic corrinoid protein MtbC1
MTRLARQHAETLDQLQRGLADLAVDALLADDPAIDRRYGGAARRVWGTEFGCRIKHLIEAVAVSRPALFVAHMQWARAALLARDVPAEDIALHLESLRRVLEEELPAEAAAAACACIDEAQRSLATLPQQPASPLDALGEDSTLARLYLLHLLQRDKDEAARLVIQARRNGMPLARIYTRILMPALAEIGRMWHLQEASIADEHSCTAATQSIIAQLRADLPRAPWNGHRALCCSVGGDHHELGIRMVADLLELDGWQVEYLGSNTPVAEVLLSLAPAEHGGERPFDLLALGANTTLSVRAVADTVAAVRSLPGPHLPILVGGTPFCIVPDLWRAVGADASASCAAGAVESARALVAQRSGGAAGACPADK